MLAKKPLLFSYVKWMCYVSWIKSQLRNKLFEATQVIVMNTWQYPNETYPRRERAVRECSTTAVMEELTNFRQIFWHFASYCWMPGTLIVVNPHAVDRLEMPLIKNLNTTERIVSKCMTNNFKSLSVTDLSTFEIWRLHCTRNSS